MKKTNKFTENNKNWPKYGFFQSDNRLKNSNKTEFDGTILSDKKEHTKQYSVWNRKKSRQRCCSQLQGKWKLFCFFFCWNEIGRNHYLDLLPFLFHIFVVVFFFFSTHFTFCIESDKGIWIRLQWKSVLDVHLTPLDQLSTYVISALVFLDFFFFVCSVCLLTKVLYNNINFQTSFFRSFLF